MVGQRYGELVEKMIEEELPDNSPTSFIVYDASTGAYIGHGECGKLSVEFQAGGQEGAAVLMVESFPTPIGFFMVDLTKLGDPSQVHDFADVTKPRSPTADEAGLPDLLAARVWGDIVNEERERRLLAGKLFDGIGLRGTDRDMTILTSLVLGAQMRIAGGDVVTTTTYRDLSNVDHELTPPQIIALWQQGSTYVSALYAASWEIKSMVPVPADVADDSLWP